MSKTTWYKDSGGIYSKERVGRDGETYTQFFVRCWIPSEKRMRTFKAGKTYKSAEREQRRVLGDPDAAMQKRERVAEQRRQKADAVAEALTVAELYQTFLHGYRSRGGTDYHRNVLRSFVEAYGKTAASAVTVEKIDAYIRKRRAARTAAGRPKVGDSTIRKECLALGLMFKWGKRRGLVAINPLLDYEKPTEPVGAPARALTYEEEDAILALMPPLESDMVRWLLDSGMRLGEALALTWPRVDRGAGVIHVVGTKTGKLRTVPLSLSDRLVEVLERHPQRTTTALVFHDRDGKKLDKDQLNGMLEAAMKAAGVPKFRGVLFNVLRKTWTSRIYDAGARPQDEADWAGHSMAVADKHYREHAKGKRERSDGLLNRSATAARTAASTLQVVENA